MHQGLVYVFTGGCALKITFVVVGQLHVEADVVRERTQVLHQCVQLPHQQDTGLLSVAAHHGRHLAVVIAKTRKGMWEIILTLKDFFTLNTLNHLFFP